MGAPNGPPSGHPGAAGPSCELGRVPSVRESPSDDNYNPDPNFRGVRIREYRTSGGGGVIRLCAHSDGAIGDCRMRSRLVVESAQGKKHGVLMPLQREGLAHIIVRRTVAGSGGAGSRAPRWPTSLLARVLTRTVETLASIRSDVLECKLIF